MTNPSQTVTLTACPVDLVDHDSNPSQTMTLTACPVVATGFWPFELIPKLPGNTTWAVAQPILVVRVRPFGPRAYGRGVYFVSWWIWGGGRKYKDQFMKYKLKKHVYPP